MAGKRDVTLADLFLAKQIEMEAALGATRTVIEHAGEKGTAAELRWRTMLREYLPKRYSVRTGFVVDSDGRRSDQIDVIIHDQQYSPLVFEAGSSCFVPAESVYAVFDSKQKITRTTIKQAGEKVASVRSLSRTSGTVHTNTGPYDGKDPSRQPILGGILALDVGWTSEFGSYFVRAIEALDQPLEQLNLGCAVSAGGFELSPDEPAAMVRTYPRESALVGFFIGLIRQLQPLATALVMDLDVWGGVLPTND